MHQHKARKKLNTRHLNGHLDFSSGFQVIDLQTTKKCQNRAKNLGTSIKIFFQRLITHLELDKKGWPFKCLRFSFFTSFLLMLVISSKIELEISPFLTVIQFYSNIVDKRVGKAPQEISTRTTFRNILTNLKGTR